MRNGGGGDESAVCRGVEGYWSPLIRVEEDVLVGRI